MSAVAAAQLRQGQKSANAAGKLPHSCKTSPFASLEADLQEREKGRCWQAAAHRALLCLQGLQGALKCQSPCCGDHWDLAAPLLGPSLVWPGAQAC